MAAIVDENNSVIAEDDECSPPDSPSLPPGPRSDNDGVDEISNKAGDRMDERASCSI